MYGVESSFWLTLLLLIGFILIVGFSFNTLLRKWLKVERPKLFSYNHVNDLHKKMDWGLRGLIVVLMITGYFVNIQMAPQESILFLEVWFLLLVLIITTEVVRAFMEWKYAKNPKAYIVTVSQLLFILILLSSIFVTDFYGLMPG